MSIVRSTGAIVFVVQEEFDTISAFPDPDHLRL